MLSFEKTRRLRARRATVVYEIETAAGAAGVVAAARTRLETRVSRFDASSTRLRDSGHWKREMSCY